MLYDDDPAVVETLAGRLQITDPAIVVRYTRWLELLRHAAITGSAAVDLCRQVASESGRDGPELTELMDIVTRAVLTCLAEDTLVTIRLRRDPELDRAFREAPKKPAGPEGLHRRRGDATGARPIRPRVTEQRSKPVVDDEMSAADQPEQITVLFRKPAVRPGTPEAQTEGCLCSFESNMRAGFLSAERGNKDEVLVVIHADCPLHKIVRKPMDDVLGDEGFLGGE